MTLKEFLQSLKAPVEGVYFASGGTIDLRGRTYLSPEEKRLVAKFLEDVLFGTTGREKAPGHLYFRLSPEGVLVRGSVAYPTAGKVELEASLEEAVRVWGTLAV